MKAKIIKKREVALQEVMQRSGGSVIADNRKAYGKFNTISIAELHLLSSLLDLPLLLFLNQSLFL